jgi:hypothetical protein
VHAAAGRVQHGVDVVLLDQLREGLLDRSCSCNDAAAYSRGARERGLVNGVSKQSPEVGWGGRSWQQPSISQ